MSIQKILIGVGTLWGVSGHLLHTRQKRRAPVIQPLSQDGNAFFYGKLKIGDQDVNVIPDTGSFQMVVFSDDCTDCKGDEELFHREMSSTHEKGTIVAEQIYGLGEGPEWVAVSNEAYDTLTLGGLTTPRQPFWEIYTEDNQPPGAEENPVLLGGIMGLGAPQSAIDMAVNNAQEAQKEYDDLEASGELSKMSSGEVQNLSQRVARYDQVATFTSSAKTFMETVGIQDFSVCMDWVTDSGRIIYNDDTDILLFSHEIEVKGYMGETALYWSTIMRKVRVKSDVPGDHGTNSFGCESNYGCLAVLDTGTSLIAAPQLTYDKLVKIVHEYNVDSDGCKDIDSMPQLEFLLGGRKINLPPDSWIAEMEEDSVPPALLKVMPHLHLFREAARKRRQQRGKQTNSSALRSGEGPPRETFCAPLLMSSELDHGWILGVPFFRQYYTSFVLSADLRPDVIRLGEAADDCTLAPKTELRRTAQQRRQRMSRKAHVVDGAKLRIPDVRGLQKKR